MRRERDLSLEGEGGSSDAGEEEGVDRQEDVTMETPSPGLLVHLAQISRRTRSILGSHTFATAETSPIRIQSKLQIVPAATPRKLFRYFHSLSAPSCFSAHGATGWSPHVRENPIAK